MTTVNVDQGPITLDVLQQTAAKIGVKVPADKADGFVTMLASAREAIEEVMAMNDFMPQVDLESYPRQNVVEPKAEDNPYNAWATKVTVKNSDKAAAEEGILAGKRVVLKDNICLAGVPCYFGTDVFTDWVPTTDATVVTRVLEAGGTITGKASCENFCAYAISNSSRHGPIGNPYDKTRSAAGSSSGCGVLVAIGEADLAIGGDQGGSIRLPAAQVGIVGFKPTFGLVPYTGIASNEVSLDHAGPMSPDVLSNALLLRAIAGTDNWDDRQIAGTPSRASVPDYPALLTAARNARKLTQMPVKTNMDVVSEEPGATRKMRVGILKEAFEVQTMDAKVKECVLRAARRFEEVGAEVVEVSVPGHFKAPVIARVQRMSQSNNLLARANGTRQLYLNDFTEKIIPWSQEKFDKLFPVTANIFLNGLYVDEHFPQVHGKAHNLFRKLKYEYDAVLDDVDLLIMPTAPWVAKVMLPRDAPLLDHFEAYNGLTFNTQPFNNTGHPALSVPCGMVSPPEGPATLKLPVGMQLVAKYWDELTLYKAALAWSDAFDWKEQ